MGDNIGTSFLLGPSDSDMDRWRFSEAEDFCFRLRTLLPKFFLRTCAGDAENSEKINSVEIVNFELAIIGNFNILVWQGWVAMGSCH